MPKMKIRAAKAVIVKRVRGATGILASLLGSSQYMARMALR